MDTNPGITRFFTAISDTTELLDLIKELAAKGVFPTAKGWYRDGESHLDGDFEAFEDLFGRLTNHGTVGANNHAFVRSSISTVRTRLTSRRLPNGGKFVTAVSRYQTRLPVACLRKTERNSRRSFTTCITPTSFALRRNYLNFSFLQLFAFVLLCEDHELREELGYEYVMVDEFQDSSEIQFKLTLLLAGTNNICVVGDWKQSIYSFQYADVDNIREFETRLERFTTS